jgi:hypothetical protein
MTRKTQKEIEWIDTPYGQEWLREARSHRKTLGFIVGEWEEFGTIDILDSHPISHWVEGIFRRADKRHPNKECSIIIGNWFNFHPYHLNHADLDASAYFHRDQLEAGWIKTGELRYLEAAEKIGNPKVEWRSIV